MNLSVRFTSDSRNAELVSDFALYCAQHPSERFWQALRNWSGYGYVMVADIKPEADDFDSLRAIQDTFHWEGRRR